MKIERMNEKQIKCSINKEDLSIRGLSISELAYGSENAKNLFDEILKQAFLEVGFQSDDTPLIVEATPLVSGNLIILITKDMEPEELDTRFSKFSPESENTDNFPTEISETDYPLMEKTASRNHFEQKMEEGFISFPEMLQVQKSEKPENTSPSFKVFTFPSLADICDFAEKTGGQFKGKAAVYKNTQRNLYYLILDYCELEKDEMTKVQTILSEYSTSLKGNYATIAYIQEHFEPIVKEDALTVLASL